MKKIIYLISSTILGVLFSFILHAGIETLYLKYTEEISWHHGCALPYWLQISLILIGAIGGYFLGRFWWRLVYVDRGMSKIRRQGELKIKRSSDWDVFKT